MSGTSSNAAPAVRRPRMRFLANGVSVGGIFEAGVTSNNHLAADKWTATVVLPPVADGSAQWWDPAGTAGTPGISPVTAEVQFAFLPDGAPEGNAPWQSFCFGDLDHVHFDPIRRVLHVDGRDLVGRLVDYRIRENYPNKTSSEIVQLLAGKVGITCDVTATSTPVGQYYRLEHDRVSLDGFSKNQKAWDVMCYLARQEGYDVYMGPPTGGSGPANVLHFHPSAKQGTSQPGFTARVAAVLVCMLLAVVAVGGQNYRDNRPLIASHAATASAKTAQVSAEVAQAAAEDHDAKISAAAAEVLKMFRKVETAADRCRI